MILSALQICFVVFLASFPCPRAQGSSRESQYNGNGTLKDSNGFSNHTRCSWNCVVVNSNVPEQRRTDLAQNRFINLAVEYEKTVDKKCVKQTSRNSSGNATEYFKVLLPANKNLFSFDQAMEISSNLIICSHSEERIEVKAVCSLLPVGTSSVRVSESIIDTGFLSRFVVSHLADHGFKVKRSNECNTEKMYNDLHPCITSSNSTLSETDSYFTEQHGSVGWVDLFFLVFLFAFVFYSPVIICLFSPTLVTENGLRQIVLEGASPVSFRSLVGNYIFSGSDTIWHKARVLIFRLVVLPFPFLLQATISDQCKYVVLLFDLSKPVIKLSLACYAIKAFYDSFTFKISQPAVEAKPCLVCFYFKPNLICNGELPSKIWHHLRMQPLILVRCWSFFLKCLGNCFKRSLIILPRSRKMSPFWFVRTAGFLVFLLITPAIIIILLAATILRAFFHIVVTSPICNVTYGEAQKIVLFPIEIFATWGAKMMLANVAAVVATVTGAAFILLSSEKSLPFVILFGIVCYYLCSSYSSFTNNYHDLSLKLFEYYKKNRRDQISDGRATIMATDAVRAENTASPEDRGNVVKIPKELFDMACEELMPIREGVCILVLKVCFSLGFVFLFFLFIMHLDDNVSPGVKALATFFTGPVPKVLAICTDGGRQEKLDAMVIEEKAPRIVQDYINSIQGQGYTLSGANTNEMITVDESEETIPIATV